MPLTYTEIRNKILNKIRENLAINPGNIAEIAENVVDVVELNETSFTQAFYGSLSTSDSNPFPASQKGFALANESGTYSNLPGAPVVDLSTSPISFLVYDGSTTTVDGFSVDLTNYYTKAELDAADGKEDKGYFSANVDAKNNKIINLVDDHSDLSSAVPLKLVWALLHNYVKTHNPDLTFQDVKVPSDPTPLDPNSVSDNDAWIMIGQGVWQGQTVEIGDIMYYSGGTYYKQLMYSNYDNKKYII